jgi:hypothetical protein
MALYRCFILGENFPGVMLGQSTPIGFYTTRFVEASSPSEAEMLALDVLKADDALDVPPEARSENAMVYFETIEEVPADTERVPNGGFTFFTMGT